MQMAFSPTCLWKVTSNISLDVLLFVVVVVGIGGVLFPCFLLIEPLRNCFILFHQRNKKKKRKQKKNKEDQKKKAKKKEEDQKENKTEKKQKTKKKKKLCMALQRFRQ